MLRACEVGMQIVPFVGGMILCWRDKLTHDGFWEMQIISIAKQSACHGFAELNQLFVLHLNMLRLFDAVRKCLKARVNMKRNVVEASDLPCCCFCGMVNIWRDMRVYHDAVMDKDKGRGDP